MSQTTTAATSGATRPSFDFVLSCFPEELSASRACDLDESDDRGSNRLPELPHADESSPRVNVASLCRNTFVHLESASPLAKLSHSQLLESFKNFSNKLTLHTGKSHTPSDVEHEEGEAEGKSDTKETAVDKEAIWSHDSPSGISLRESEHGCSQVPPMASPYKSPTGTTRTSPFFLDDISKETDTPTRPPKEAFDLSEWLHSLDDCLSHPDGQSLRRGGLYDLLYDDVITTHQLTNLFASAIAQSLLQPPQDEWKKKDVDAKTPDTAEVEQLGHPTNCKPCAFFWSKGCLNGDKCQFCHMWHVPKRKKPMKEQKNLMIIAREDGKIAFLRCAIQDALTV